MPKIGTKSPAMQAIKSQYMEAERNNDKPKMNKLKQKAMAEMKKAESKEDTKTETSPTSDTSLVTNADGDSLDISSEALLNNSDTKE